MRWDVDSSLSGDRFLERALLVVLERFTAVDLSALGDGSLRPVAAPSIVAFVLCDAGAAHREALTNVLSPALELDLLTLDGLILLLGVARVLTPLASSLLALLLVKYDFTCSLVP